jgi:membrane-associated phospholipid phosphatase
MKRTAVALILVSATAWAGSQASPPSDAPRAAPSSDAPPPPAAEHPVVGVPAAWPREYPAVGVWDFVAVGALAVGNVIIVLTPVPEPAVWTGGILFDDWVRNGLRLGAANARLTASSASDWLIAILAVFPLADAWLDAGWGRGRVDVAWRLTVIDTEALLTTTFLSLGVQRLTARQRPWVAACLKDPTGADCSTGSAANTSFPSGHTSVAFTAAVLECVNHGRLDVERTGWSAAACPLTLSLAAFTGLLRIASDRHYASDVLVGALLGSGIGYLVPTLHFALAPKSSATVTPVVSTNYTGLALTGRF